MPEKIRIDGNATVMNAPASRFVPQTTSKQKDSCKDIRCAEIKMIPSMKNSDQERSPKTFKIGEYNRATASFEIPSVPNTPVAEVESQMSSLRPEFDFSVDLASDQYFQSAFARSVASSQSKSVDYGVNGKISVNGNSECLGKMKTSVDTEIAHNNNSAITSAQQNWQLPGKENWDLRRADVSDVTDDELLTIGLDDKLSITTHNLDNGKERSRSRSSSSTFNRPSSDYFDNRSSPLPGSCRSSQHRSYSSASDMTTVMLQSQVTTLQWQLRQAEASRQMHRAVLEQVVGFLQRTHRNLDLLQSSPYEGGTLTRVPRSRSVHAVETSPSRLSLPRSELSASFHKAKSTTTITDPNCPKHGDAFREMTLRRQKRIQAEDDIVHSAKLSEEAFRLLRTVQSLLNTREPDLTTRLHSGGSSPIQGTADASSTSSTTSAVLDSDATSSDNFQSQDTVVHVGARPELQAAFGGNCSPIPGLPAAHLKDATMSLGRRRRRRTIDVFAGEGSPPQLSTSSADDESGFSSLNSFHDNGTPSTKSNHHCQEVGVKHMRSQCDVIHEEKRGSFQEIGLPLRAEENCKIHRRWSSTQADNMKPRNGSLNNVIRVLWV